MGDTLRIARHEWRLILKEPRFLAPFLIMPLLLLGMQAYALFSSPGVSGAESALFARALLLMLAVLAPAAVVPLGADTFAGEKERNTLEILLCLPVSRGALFWGKVLGIYPLPVLMGWLGQAAMAAMAMRGGSVPGGFGADVFKAMLLTPFLGLFLSALAALVSLASESVRGAAQLTSLFTLALFFAVTGLSHAYFAYPAAYLAVIAGLAAAAALCFLLARRRFPELS